MIPALREEFNRNYTPGKYQQLLQSLDKACGTHIGFRVSETPCFVPRSLLDLMAQDGRELVAQLVDNPEYRRASDASVPPQYNVPKESPLPMFVQIDFGLVRSASGELEPKLVELQAFPSLYGYQPRAAHQYVESYGLSPDLGIYLSGHDHHSYWKLMRQLIVADHDPENVILMEIDPEQQKTLPDFLVMQRELGIAVVDILSLKKRGKQLVYSKDGREIEVRRIYNRCIVDELERKGVTLPFDLRDELDVEWAGHPNWYFLISKFSVPWLCRPPGSHPVVPPAVFLDEFLAGNGRAELAAAGVPLPQESAPETVYSELLLKPLFSFAGKGIQFEPSQAQLEAIPVAGRKDFLLQQRMRFEHTIETPKGLTQAEIRILYLWPDSGNLTPAMSLVRLGRGKMMGVDHNRNQEWVGASAAFFPHAQNPESNQ